VARIALTDRFIKSESRVPSAGRVDFFDSIVPGLAVRITPAGHRSFVLVARFPSRPKNPTRRALGEYGALTLDAARDKARAWLELIGKGIDPKVQEARKRAEERRKVVTTFGAIVEAYLDRNEQLAKHGEAKRVLQAEFKDWRERPAADITTEEVADAIRAIVKRNAPYQAFNVLGHLRRVYSWAIGTHEFGLTASPVAALKPKSLIGPRKPRTRILSDDELRRIWDACAGETALPEDGKRVRADINAATMGYPYGPLVRLLILTGQREREVADAVWAEFDLDARIWTIPSERMKGGRTHEVPLAPDALALIKSLPRFSGPHLFSTTGGAKPVNGFSKAKARLDKLSGVQGWVLHDLRRTARTHFSALAVQDLVREAVIAHAQKGLHAVYDQHTYRDEKLECLRLWEKRLAAIVAPKKPAEVADIAEARAARAGA